MKLSMVKASGHGLRPVHKSDVQKYSTIVDGEIIKVTISKERFVPLHNKWKSLLRLYVKNTSDPMFQTASYNYNDVEAAMNKVSVAIKYEIGWTDEITDLHGNKLIVPKPMDFESLPDDDEFMEKVYIPGRAILAKLLRCTEDDIENNSVYHL